jgi:chemotaxis protein methyltransferase CheR
MPPPDSLGLSRTAVPLLRDLVHDRLGVYYDDSRMDSLADRVAPLVIERGFDSFLDYYYLLRYDPGAAAEWGRVMDAVSVPETYFWREVDQLRAVVDLVVPALARELAGRPLRIWSLPCATGEEPLTLAMLLEEAGWFARAPIEIHAGDGSPMAIRRAQAGEYRERAFRALPDALKARYFQPTARGWAVDPLLHARVRSWSVLNLMDGAAVSALAGTPIVLCRNVFIYFSDATVRGVLEQFARVMSTPGYLCVGASESLLKFTSRFELEEYGGAFIYVKRSEGSLNA